MTATLREAPVAAAKGGGMRIVRMELENFKRFTHLTLEGIPPEARLVLLIGANGSGKSCIFDAFNYASETHKGDRSPQLGTYYPKSRGLPGTVDIQLADGSRFGREPGPYGTDHASRFFGRSSLRIVPRLGSSRLNEDAIARDADAPQLYIEQDSRFLLDALTFTRQIDRALRAPLFEGATLDTADIRGRFIDPLNDSLARIFQTGESTSIALSQFESMTLNAPPRLVFRKGGSTIDYDLLSHGEKQVLIVLLNFVVRKHLYQDAVIYIDELDAHLNTALQFNVLREVVENWLPPAAQLWTASHSLGFIDYARRSPEAAILDFDDCDFDQPVILTPAPRESRQVFEIAVPPEMLPRLFQGREVILCENRDADVYGSLGLEGYVFLGKRDKGQAFATALGASLRGLLDRDYLTDGEVHEFETRFPGIRFLRLYSLENYLYHPDNLQEVRGG
ncbi:MAG: AAA family ATPase, partial [Candidatus Eremiobacterota bacterium]